MELLYSWIASGWIVVPAIAFVVLEIIGLVLYRRRTGRGVPPRSLLVNAGAGVSLMLALGAALRQDSPLVIAAALVGALVFHLADLAQRWRR